MRVHRRGFALILVLIVVGAVFAVSMQAAVVSRSTRVEAIVLHDRAERLPGARAAAALVVQGLSMSPSSESPEPSFDSGLDPVGSEAPGQSDEDLEFLRQVLEMMPPEQRAEFERKLEEARKKRDPQVDQLAQGGGIPGGARAGGGLTTMQRVGLPGAPIDVEVRGRVYRVTVRDAGGLLNVNMADDRRLQNYFALVGATGAQARAIAHQIIDWRDEDSFTNELGAERERYQRVGIEIRNAPIVSLEELQYLPAMTDELFENARSGLCTSGDGKTHAGSAPIEVIQSMPGVSSEAARRIVEARERGTLSEQTLTGLLPMGREISEQFRFAPTNILWIGVECVDEPSIRFEGIAVVGDRGVQELGLKPV